MAQAVQKVAAELAELGLQWPGTDGFVEGSVVFGDATRKPALKDFKPQEVMRHLVDHGHAVAIDNDYFIHATARTRLLDQVRDHFSREQDLAFAGFRELSGLSRKLGIPMLEHLDETEITVRKGDVRQAGPRLNDRPGQATS